MSSTQSEYSDSAVQAMQSERLQKSLASLQGRFGKGAMQIWAEMADQEMRTRVKAARMHNLEHLDILLSELAAAIRTRGGKVFFARTAEEAANYALEVARKNGVKRVVKGKSMLSAEIGLDAVLEAEQIEVVETDLGEYIIQLAGDKPSHIIAPCIHMDRQAIGKLFTEKLGIDYTDDPPTLTMAARKALREKLVTADMGITGCNLACAETGQVTLVSNEGNIRMSTTVPPIHIAIMGMERICATLEEHGQTLQLLTRGAALQKISTYVSFIGGPSRPSDPDGPKEFHLIIVDNGRSKILADPDFREVLACIRCGACLNICPVYGKIGGHAYHATYSGPIGAVLMPLLDGINKHADLCKGETLCGACKDVCPVNNDLPRMLSALRHKLAYGSREWNTAPHSTTEARTFKYWAKLISSPVMYRMAIKAGRFIQRRFIGKNGMIGHIPGFASRWTQDRDLSPLAARTFAERWQKRKTASTPSPDGRQGEE
jgi:L-lactate dehydrogenase complex protein LldF